MAETEAIENETPETKTESFEFDESLLTIVKGRALEPKKPDFSESRLYRSKLQEQVRKYLDRNQEINSILNETSQKLEDNKAGNQDIIAKLKNLRSQRNQVIAKKQGIRDRLTGLSNQRTALRTQVQQVRGSLRDQVRGVPFDKFEAEFQQIEFQLEHGSLSDAEEKKFRGQMQALKSARPFLQQISDAEARIKAGEEERSALQAQLAVLDVDVQTFDGLIDASNTLLDNSKDSVDIIAADFPRLKVERKENSEIIDELRNQMTELRKQEDEQYEDFIKRDRAYRAWRRVDSHRKYEERQREREARKAEAESERDVKPQDRAEPYTEQISVCDQLLAYLRGLQTPAGKAARGDEVVEAAPAAAALPAGFKPLKKDSNLGALFAVGGKKGKGAKAAAKAAEPAKPKVFKINLAPELIVTFSRFRIKVPQTSENIAATVEAVEEVKASFLAKRQAKKDAAEKGVAYVDEDEKADEEEKVEEEEKAEEEEKQEEDAPAEEATPASPVAEEEPEAEVAREEEPAEVAAPAEGKQEEEAQEEAAAAPAVEEDDDKVVALSITPDGESVKLAITAR